MKFPIFLIVLGAILLGTAAGISAYTFIYAKGYSYITDDPAACANCHVMNEQYNGWVKSAHKGAAVCNDCHTPAGVIPKYLTKMENGFRHSFAFTSGAFPEPIRITDRNRGVTDLACRKCHAGITETIDGSHETSKELSCLPCHRRVGHL